MNINVLILLIIGVFVIKYIWNEEEPFKTNEVEYSEYVSHQPIVLPYEPFIWNNSDRPSIGYPWYLGYIEYFSFPGYL